MSSTTDRLLFLEYLKKLFQRIIQVFSSKFSDPFYRRYVSRHLLLKVSSQFLSIIYVFGVENDFRHFSVQSPSQQVRLRGFFFTIPNSSTWLLEMWV